MAIENKPCWTVTVKEIADDSWPVVVWSYGLPHISLNKGELRTKLFDFTFIFIKHRIGPGEIYQRRRPIQHNLSSIDAVMIKINELGWEEPPYLEEIFLAMLSIKGKPKTRGILREIKEKWEAIIVPQKAEKAGAGVISIANVEIFKLSPRSVLGLKSGGKRRVID